MVKIYHLWSCHAKLSKKNNPMYFLCQRWFLNHKKEFCWLFSQSVDFQSNCWLFDQNVDFLDLCKNERGYGSKLEQKCMRGKNGNKKKCGAKLGYDSMSNNLLDLKI